MKIEFYIVKTGEVLRDTDTWLFIMNDKVYEHLAVEYESCPEVLRYSDFISERPDIAWRVVD